MLRQIIRNYAKIFKSSDEAIASIKSGMTILGGGFGTCGVPNSLMLAATRKQDLNNLTFVSNNAGIENYGIGLLLNAGKVKKMISSYVGENKSFEHLYLSGQLEVELTPQGTLAEKIRCGGAGIPIFATPTGVGTLVETGGIVNKYNEKREPEILSLPRQTYFDDKGKKYLLEKSIRGDVAFIKAWQADKFGNLRYRKSAMNFNSDMATAADYVIAEVEEFVDEIEPQFVHTPCVYVNAMVKSEDLRKPVEKITNTKNMAFSKELEKDPKNFVRFKIAKRAAQEVHDRSFLNLGIGIPTMVPSFIPHNLTTFVQSENGLMGVDGYPEPGEEDGDLIDAAKQSVIIKKGGSFFSSSSSFAMIRGAHLDFTMLGGMEVAANGDLANWIIPGKMVKGMGGAMDLVGSGSKVIVLMEHTSKGKPKILESCTLPLTGKHVVNKIITELAVFEVKPEGKGLVLTDIASETTLHDVIISTGCSFDVSTNLKTF